MIAPPRWADEQLEAGIQAATETFRRQRMREPLESYLQAFAHYEAFVGELLAASAVAWRRPRGLPAALRPPANPNFLEAFRYFAGPPLSADDLRTLSEGVLSPARLRGDPAMVCRIVTSSAWASIAAASPGSPKIVDPPRRNARPLCWRPPR